MLPIHIHASSAGHHCLALTVEGHVFSRGSGRNGKLGHGDTQDLVEFKRVERLGGKAIAVGSGKLVCPQITNAREQTDTDFCASFNPATGRRYSGVVMSTGELFTWGESNFVCFIV